MQIWKLQRYPWQILEFQSWPWVVKSNKITYAYLWFPILVSVIFILSLSCLKINYWSFKSLYPCLSTCLERFMNCQWRCWYIFSFLLQVPLKVVEPLDSKALNGLKLSLSGDHQFSNAGLAVSLCKSWLQRTGNWEKLFQKVSFTNPSSHRYVLHKIIYQSSVGLLNSWILFFFMDWTMLSSDNNNTQIDACEWLCVCTRASLWVSVIYMYVYVF